METEAHKNADRSDPEGVVEDSVPKEVAHGRPYHKNRHGDGTSTEHLDTGIDHPRHMEIEAGVVEDQGDSERDEGAVDDGFQPGSTRQNGKSNGPHRDFCAHPEYKNQSGRTGIVRKKLYQNRQREETVILNSRAERKSPQTVPLSQRSDEPSDPSEQKTGNSQRKSEPDRPRGRGYGLQGRIAWNQGKNEAGSEKIQPDLHHSSLGLFTQPSATVKEKPDRNNEKDRQGRGKDREIGGHINQFPAACLPRIRAA